MAEQGEMDENEKENFNHFDMKLNKPINKYQLLQSIIKVLCNEKDMKDVYLNRENSQSIQNVRRKSIFQKKESSSFESSGNESNLFKYLQNT